MIPVKVSIWLVIYKLQWRYFCNFESNQFGVHFDVKKHGLQRVLISDIWTRDKSSLNAADDTECYGRPKEVVTAENIRKIYKIL